MSEDKKAEPTEEVEEVEEKATEKAEETQDAPPQPALKTPQENQDAAFIQERRKRKELEQQIAELKSEMQNIKSTSAADETEDVYSDEGKLLKGQLSELQKELKAMREERELSSVYSQYPSLKDTADEFDEFRSEYPGVEASKLAKLFLAEKGISPSKRKGLEKPSGGSRTPSSGMTWEDISELRKNNPRKYQTMLRSGEIDLSKVKSK